MKSRTAAGQRLKRLAKRYADSFHDLLNIGCRHPDTHDEIRARFQADRKALYAAIDDATSLDLTPRAVSEQS